MNEIIRAIVQPEGDDYANLPQAVKTHYTRDEYLWLSDAEKATLVQRECEPDC